MNTRVWMMFAAVVHLTCAALIYFFAPERVPLLFDSSGEVAHFEPKTEILLGHFVVLGTLTAIWLALQSQTSNQRQAQTIFSIAVAFICALQVLTVLPFLMQQLQIPTGDTFLRAAFCCIGAMLLLVGNFAPKLTPNSWDGVQNPYCFASRKAWFATNRIAGQGMVGLGLLLLLLALVLPSVWLLETMTATLLGAVVLGYFALWFYSKKVWLQDPERRPLDSPFEV